MFSYQNLKVYDKSELLYANLVKVLKNARITPYHRSQLDRAASSIMLNIAEGAGRSSTVEKKRFYTIARGSANEVLSVLRVLHIRQELSTTDYKTMEEQTTEVAKMLSGLIKAMLVRTKERK